MNLEQVAESAMKLPIRDRTELASRLLQSLDEDRFIEVDEDFSQMLRRRIDDVRSGRVQPIPGDQVLREVREALSRK